MGSIDGVVTIVSPCCSCCFFRERFSALIRAKGLSSSSLSSRVDDAGRDDGLLGDDGPSDRALRDKTDSFRESEERMDFIDRRPEAGDKVSGGIDSASSRPLTMVADSETAEF